MPDGITYNAWISACERQAAIASPGVLPGDAITRHGAQRHHLRHLNQGLRKGKQPEQALELFQAMRQQGSVPNVLAYRRWREKHS